MRFIDGLHLDLIDSIIHVVERSPLVFTGRYINVHRHDYANYDDLGWWEQSNIDMDQLAKSSMYHQI